MKTKLRPHDLFWNKIHKTFLSIWTIYKNLHSNFLFMKWKNQPCLVLNRPLPNQIPVRSNITGFCHHLKQRNLIALKILKVIFSFKTKVSNKYFLSNFDNNFVKWCDRQKKIESNIYYIQCSASININPYWIKTQLKVWGWANLNDACNIKSVCL